MWQEVVPGKKDIVWQSLLLKEGCVLQQKLEVTDESPCEFGTFGVIPHSLGRTAQA